MDGLNTYLKDRGVQWDLQVRIRKYFRYFWSRRTVFHNEEEILSNLWVTADRTRGAFTHRSLAAPCRLPAR